GRLAGDGEGQHLDALAEGGEFLVELVRRSGGGHEQHLVEAALFAALLRQDQVAIGDRVERAAEDAESHRPPPECEAKRNPERVIISTEGTAGQADRRSEDTPPAASRTRPGEDCTADAARRGLYGRRGCQRRDAGRPQ